MERIAMVQPWFRSKKNLLICWAMTLGLGCGHVLGADSARTIRLSAMDLSFMETGWGQAQADRSVDRNPLTIAGTQYSHGVGTHAESSYTIAVNGATRFTAKVGVDDEVRGNPASVEFVIVVDGRDTFRSGIMKPGMAAKQVDIALAGAKTMELKVTDGGDGVSYDHADWAEAEFTCSGIAPAIPPEKQPIQILTSRSAMTLFTAKDRRLYQLGYGASEKVIPAPRRNPAREDEFYPPSGNGYIFEPAIQAIHADGNTSTDLVTDTVQTETVDDNISLTRIALKDSRYPFYVTLCFRAYRQQDVIEQWAEIRHQENGPVTLYRYASSSPVVEAKNYWLTHFHGDWAQEAQWIEEPLTSGMKILDSKIGVRAHQYRSAMFTLALNQQAREDRGEVIGGTLAWSGSFQFAFEVDKDNHLRMLCGINPFGSQYRLESGQTFTTPAMLWSFSRNGKGQVSRNFHRWARQYGLRDGDKPRPILLNNWEATDMNFDENLIVSLFDGARELGVELFLLDDGWFGNKYPRNNDRAGLGDWEVNVKKLPHGLSYLADEANKRGLRFGIWTEPEMVNPASELYEKHPEWAIRQAHREPQTSRNQLNLDMSRPEVKEFVWKCIDDLFGPNPAISYTKWDCNRYVTQPGSTWLRPDQQTHLLIDYNKALYEVMARMAEKYPHVQAMLCSGGGGRVDYGALRYFHSFWPSDNTDPRSRVKIQWGYSHLFPACAMSTHATRMGSRPLKFTLDVAMSGAFGLDMDVRKLSPADRKTVAHAIALFKQTLRDIVQFGDLYRLASPYDGDVAAMHFVTADQSKAVLFIYQLNNGQANVVKPQGLNPQRKYRVREVNLLQGTASQLKENDRVLDGATLMQQGLTSPCTKENQSAVILFDGTAQ
ncbi:MAG: alpha-galactosidase [Sedimentisphaerales bacterium]|nr:alpha-galactosidase [Sedimentisphaerales bacterium]